MRKQGAGTLLFFGTTPIRTEQRSKPASCGYRERAVPHNTNYTVNGGTLDLNDFNLTATQLDGTGGIIDLGSAS